MTLWQRWLQRPQTLWFRKALFQIHLWLGVGVCLYVLAISLSGAAVVFRRELQKNFARKRIVVAVSGQRLPLDDLTQHAQRAYPSYEVDNIRESQSPDQPDDVVLERDNKRMERLFNPYTGADLGNPRSIMDRTLGWVLDLHDNLLAGQTGRTANGIGSIFVTIIALTGVVLWWPGIKNWRRSTNIQWSARFPRLNWDTHSATGFWCSLFVLMWGISGVYFCFPFAFQPIAGSLFLYSIAALHLGRFNSLTETLWIFLGLTPAILAATGLIMWWNRVLSKKFRRAQPNPARAVSQYLDQSTKNLHENVNHISEKSRKDDTNAAAVPTGEPTMKLAQTRSINAPRSSEGSAEKSRRDGPNVAQHGSGGNSIYEPDTKPRQG